MSHAGQGWLKFMLSVRFHLRVCRYDFYISRRNRFSFTLYIWDKESMGMENVLDDLSVSLTKSHGCVTD